MVSAARMAGNLPVLQIYLWFFTFVDCYTGAGNSTKNTPVDGMSAGSGNCWVSVVTENTAQWGRGTTWEVPGVMGLLEFGGESYASACNK